MIKNAGKCAFALISLFNVSTVHSEGWYIGLGGGILVGLADSVENAIVDHHLPGVHKTSDTEKDAAVKIFGGHYINPNVAFEFGYIDLGEMSYDYLAVDTGMEDPVRVFTGLGSESIDGFNIGLAGVLPLSATVSVNGRVGVYGWESESSFYRETETVYLDPRFNDIRGREAGGSSNSGQDIYYGISLGSEWFSLFYDFYDIDGDNLDVIGFSVVYELN